jgi:fructose 5-dehydrogenase cytochrome subunit
MRGTGRRIGALLIFLTGPLMAGVSHAAERPYPSADEAVIARGQYLAIAADCGACHTLPGGKPFVGGLAISTALGTIYSTNITPSADFGIGRYTEEEFSQALHRGIRRDRAHLYPAMHYTSYAKFTDDDVHAL